MRLLDTLKPLALACAGLVLAGAALAQDAALVMVGHASLPRIDTTTAQRLYTGRAVEVGNVGVVPVNLPGGHALRNRFLTQVVGQDDDKYVAYWTVRKHIGRGTPPRELASTSEVAEFVQRTPGALGYIPAAEVKPGMNVVLRP